jgi:prevent-host-death family protein
VGEHVFVHPSTNHKGNVAELAIAAEAAKLGIAVLKPLTEHERYDLAFDLGTRIVRIQCKWASRNEEVVLVRIKGTDYCPGRGYVRNIYATDEIDAIAAYCEELDACYLLPNDEFLGLSSVHLRLGPTRNGQRAGLHFAADHPLTRGAVAQLEERPDGIRQVGGSSPPSSTSITPRGSSVSVGAHEFRNRFGWYMERAKAGEQFMVTRRGKPYVRLVPVAPPALDQLTAAC